MSVLLSGPAGFSAEVLGFVRTTNRSRRDRQAGEDFFGPARRRLRDVHAVARADLLVSAHAVLAAPPDMKQAPRIGCAGWSIPADYRHLFGPGDSVLARYATRFDAVEVNSSFYRPHQRKTYQRWADTVPRGFRFSVKMPKAITHEQRLIGAGAALDRFVDEISGLGNKLGGVLVQLPPSLAFDARIAANFFAMLRRRTSAGIACEPRHASWFTAAADALWARYGIARVGADPALAPVAAMAAGKGDWRYWRWHGSPRMYYSAYDDDALRGLAAQIRADTPASAEPWIIFDNTAQGHAIGDAVRLQTLFAR